MISRDYTQEVGLKNNKKTLPRPVGFVLLAVAAVGISLGVAGVVSASKHHQRAEKASLQASTSAPATSAVPTVEK